MMDIRDFLARLSSWEGPSESGEYKCKCPAHDDRRASLSVNVGEKGIIFKCHAGCSKEDVLRAMGLTVNDLMSDDLLKARAAKRPKLNVEPSTKPAQPPAANPAEKPISKPAEKKTVDKVYPYTDEDGKVLFEVVRYIPKDFRQRVPDPAARGGYRWSIKGIRPVIYRLPEVVKAIAEDRTIYLVEGEKDADNMALLGYVATTCPMGAGKWRGEHSEQLNGADVCIIPDNDKPGREHAEKAAKLLAGVAKSVKILDIAGACPELPEKGDITDFFHLLGRETGAQLLEKLVRETATRADEPTDASEQAAALFGRIGGYCVEDGCICQSTDDGARKLCTFTAMPTRIITRDDGVNVEKLFEIEGWTRHGRPLPTVKVKAADYPAMAWVLQNWDFAANIMPGSMIKDKLRYVITEVGEMSAARETVYTHTGWRQIGGAWCYLHPGGSIGGAGVHVELDDALAGYTLDSDLDDDDAIAAATEMAFKDAMAAHISVPLLGLCYLAPLREFLKIGHAAPHFILFLRGNSGTHKSTASVLALSHFGAFDIDTMPATFHDTANNIRQKAFMLKDCLLTIDDYHPESSPQERRRMEGTAQSLARLFGDGADRGRMKADLTLQKATPSRCVAMMSGEDIPNIGESGVARLYTVDVGPNDIPINDDLEAAQEMARQGYFRRAMRGYIEWLAKRAKQLPERLPEIYYKLRKQARSQGSGLHGRAPEAIAHIMLGYEMMLNYMADTGALTQEQADAEFRDAGAIIMENSEKQSRDAQDDRPTRMFMGTISELITSKAVALKNLDDPNSSDPGVNGIGYYDAAYYYLLPDMAYTKVSKLYKDQGQEFILSKRGLYKQLRDDGYIELDADGKTTKGKTIGGKTIRLLWIPRSKIDGTKPAPKAQQTAMEWMEVSEDEIPNTWKT